MKRLEERLAERGLRLAEGRYGKRYGLKVFRMDGSGKVHEVTPPHGADLEALEALTATDPPTLTEALRVRECLSLAVARDAGSPAPPPELTAPLRNEPGPTIAHTDLPGAKNP